MPDTFRHPKYSLLTPGTSQPKMAHAAPGNEPWANVILHLSPADASGVANTCAFAGACKAVCLNTAGRGAMNSVQAARARRTKRFVQDRLAFMDDLTDDLVRFVTKCAKTGYRPAVRLNGTSDLPWWNIRDRHGMTVFDHNYGAMFYDYTKRPPDDWPSLDDYHLTYSYDPHNGWDPALDALSHGANVALVFSTPKTAPLPTHYGGIPVIDGRTHDYRFLDENQGVFVGLSALGKARKGTDFVINV